MHEHLRSPFRSHLAAGRVGLSRERVRGAQLLDAELGEPLAHIDGGLEVLALDDTGNEATGEGITISFHQ
jgi:hypothetical protein